MQKASHVLKVLGCALALSAVTATAQDRVRTAREACKVLKRGAVTYRLSAFDASGRFYCDYYDPVFWTSEFIVLRLRYHDRPEEKVGSNLVGWFGIRRSDGKLFEWNINDGTPKPLREPSDW